MTMGQKITILDEYDCVVFPDKIRVTIDSLRDPSLSDIMSELYDSDGNIYFDGGYYLYNGNYDIREDERGWYLDLYTN